MTKKRHVRILTYITGVSGLLAAVFFLLLVIYYQSAELLEPFFIFFLAIAYQCAFRLIMGVGTDYPIPKKLSPESAVFRHRAADDKLFRLFRIGKKTNRLLVSSAYLENLAGEQTAEKIRHYCMAESIHVMNAVLTAVSLLFAFFASDPLIALAVLAVVTLGFELWEIHPLLCNRYERFLLTGELSETAVKTKKAKKEKKVAAAAPAVVAPAVAAPAVAAPAPAVVMPVATELAASAPVNTQEAKQEANILREDPEMKKKDNGVDISSGKNRRPLAAIGLRQKGKDNAALNNDESQFRTEKGMEKLPVQKRYTEKELKALKKQKKKEAAARSNEELSMYGLAAALGKEAPSGKDKKSSSESTGFSAPSFGFYNFSDRK